MKKALRPFILLLTTALLATTVVFGQTAPTGNAACLDRVVEEPEKPFRHQIFQNDIDLDPAENYVVSFWAKASAATRLAVSTKNGAPPWAFFGLRENIAIGTQWQRYELPFSAAKAIPGKSRLTFNYGDASAVKIWIADVAIRLAGRDRPKDNLLVDARFEKGLGAWYTEGRQAGIFDVEVSSVAAVDAATAVPSKK
ncbi:MAG: hypothetical protein K0R17_3126 [Rariglobus sp.]|jgi:hypothetical protein|nr:hypothetical protein [Rariglobus sp.]